MPIILARTAGFCFGVRRAVKIALNEAQKRTTPLVTLGPLIHNQQAIDLLKSRGITIKHHPSEVNGETRVLIRAHGITPAVRRELEEIGMELCDATCPHVTATQKIVERHAGMGFSCVIIGDHGHAEVEGLLGCAGEKGFVVETPGDVRNLPDLEKVCVVSQTTQEAGHFEELVEIIKKRFEDVKVFKTICNATSLRQQELLEIAARSDMVLVVGGRTSANTRRLVEISESTGTRTCHVETAEEIDLSRIGPRVVVGVTAGASTPHWVIRNVVETLADHQLKNQFFLFRSVVGFLRFLIYSSLILGLGAGALTYAASCLMGQKPDFLYSLLSFLFVLSMHLINKRLSLPADENMLYGSQKRFAGYRDAFTLLAVFSIVFSLVTALFLGKMVFTLILFSIVAGLIYSLTLLPPNLSRFFRHRKLMDIPGSKDIFMALAWCMVVVVIPYLVGKKGRISGFLFTFPFVMLLVLVRSILLDVRDLEGDIALGKETIPTLLKPRVFGRLLHFMLVMIMLLLLVGWISGALPDLALFLILLSPFLLFHYTMSNRQVLYQSLLYDAFLEAPFLLAGFMTFLWKWMSAG